MGKIPQHVAFIMDGNRRYAKELGQSSSEGHRKGREKAEEVIEWCIEAGIQHITLWALSTDNWKKRSIAEQSVLFALIDEIPERLWKLKQYDTKLDFLGRIAALPKSAQRSIQRCLEELHVDNPKHFVHLALNYGGRDEIIHAIEQICVQGKSSSEINEELVSSHLFTKDIPDVDLIIRTGKQHRLSGFMPWQSEYAELVFSDSYWPAYSKEEFLQDLQNFGSVTQNYGA